VDRLASYESPDAPGSQAVRHRCRDCKQPIHGALCCGYHDEGSVFVCFPCDGSKEKENNSERRNGNQSRFASNSASNNRRSNNHTTNSTPAARRRPLATSGNRTPFFKTGDLVDRNGDIAWVTGSHPTPGGAHNLFNVKYVVDARRESFGIRMGGLKPTALEPTGRRRSTGAVGVSLLSSSARPAPQPKVPVAKRAVESTVQNIMAKTQQWISKGRQGGHPLVSFLKRNEEKKEPGYLRALQAKSLGHAVVGKQLSEEEWGWVLGMRSSLDLFQKDENEPKYHPAKSLASAWGMTVQGLNKKRRKTLGDAFLSNKRKKRDDTGETIFDSNRRRDVVYTAVNIFRKNRSMQATKDNPISTEELQDEWSKLSAEDKTTYEYMAESQKRRAVCLVSDIQTVLNRTRGSVTWSETADQLRGGARNLPIVDPETIRKFIMGLPDSCYQTTKIHPKLDEQLRGRRYQFAHAFWIFWSTAKTFAKGCQVLLVQMDEKWFYALVVRRKNKCVPYLGIVPINHPVRHKSHIGKVLVICSTAFEPIDNDMEKGGTGHKLSFTRVGRMSIAKRDSYRRVYKPDGGYHYPKDPENQLQKVGDPVWQHLEINGSSEGTDSNPKFSLLKWYEDIEIPALKELAQRREAALGKRIRIAYQIDGAGPHQDTKLLTNLTKQLREMDSFLSSNHHNHHSPTPTMPVRFLSFQRTSRVNKHCLMDPEWRRVKINFGKLQRKFGSNFQKKRSLEHMLAIIKSSMESSAIRAATHLRKRKMDFIVGCGRCTSQNMQARTQVKMTSQLVWKFMTVQRK
jgi:hypothetical protein